MGIDIQYCFNSDLALPDLASQVDLRDGDWCDLVGDNPVVYPEHLMEIEARLLQSLEA